MANYLNNKPEDKIIEKERYDDRALSIIKNDMLESSVVGSKLIPLPLRSPYLFYEEKIKELIKPTFNVLEIGSGAGLHTYSLIKTCASVMATDISPNSLQVLERRLLNVEGRDRLKTMVVDMELLPFENGSFDVVASAGSLSYGDAKKVDCEIIRVLKPNGLFICVDSLNHNPIYKFNRYIRFLQDARSKMTLLNMPTIQRINSLTKKYKYLDVKYFGCISFMMPILSKLLGDNSAADFSNYVDKITKVKKSAFKFVLTAQA